MRFALMEIKSTLAKLLLKYRLEPADNLPRSKVELEANPVLMRIKNGLKCRAIPL